MSSILEPELAAGYDRVRPLAGKPFRAACYAPFNSMYLDTFGLVRACCVNRRYVLGELTRQRLDDIWFGNRARSLRDAMVRYDLRMGCEFCEWQIRNGNFTDPRAHQASVHAKKYDGFGVERAEPPTERGAARYWPTNLEFNLSNTCNLECVTCNGEFSSSIRSRREKLPPLPRVYGDEFFADLEKYLVHVRSAQFLGGEPFLITEHFRVWEMMARQNTMEWVGILTNGTIWNDKVERVLATLPVTIAMSMDGVTKQTFEAIRTNAVYETFMENFRRFLAYCRGHKRQMGFNFTLSRLNQHEFADFLLFADSYDCDVNVCTLVFPEPMSLYTLPRAELAVVIRDFERRDDEMKRSLQRNRVVWDSALANLRNELRRSHETLPVAKQALVLEEAAAAPPSVAGEPERAVFAEAARPSRLIDGFASAPPLTPDQEEAGRRDALARLAAWSSTPVEQLLTGSGDVIERVENGSGSFLGLGVDLVGRTLEDLRSVLAEKLGHDWKVDDLEATGARIDRIMDLGVGTQRNAMLRAIILPRFGGADRLAGLRVLMARR
ncbi:MAG TPA: SPASM domain-containing protein [Planctomycetota bacterium]|nr:SPASM domain-containing protein [Planctomycetota bacterium]